MFFIVDLIFSSDDWLEKKKTTDGAESLWRIHDKLYDFTVWARIHPGGNFWIETSRGTDITEAFETHHFSEKAEFMLEKFYIREATTPRNSNATFEDNGFFKTFKQRIRELGPSPGMKISAQSVLWCDVLAANVFLSAVLSVKFGGIWPLVSGLFLGMLSVSVHNFLHGKNNWRSNYLNLSLMSSRDWRVRHVLSHHQYPNSALDCESAIFRRFVLEGKNPAAKLFNFLLRLSSFAVSSHVQFIRRCLEVVLSHKLRFQSEELVGISLPLFLLAFTGSSLWDVFFTWNLIISAASFTFNAFTSDWIHRQSDIIWQNNPKRDDKDFGIVQLSRTAQPQKDESLFSFLYSNRRNPLHYLCPAFDWSNLSRLIPVFQKTCEEFGILYKKKTSFLEGLTRVEPTGQTFFS